MSRESVKTPAAALDSDRELQQQQAIVAMPPMIERVLVFFYVVIWINLLGLAYGQFTSTTDGDYGFLVPTALYGLLMIGYNAYNYTVYRRRGGQLSDVLWGYGEPSWLPLAYLVASFALVFWMTAESDSFWALYIGLWATSFGMLPWRRAIPLVAVAVVAMFYQLGVIEAILAGASFEDSDLGIVFYMILLLAYAGVIAVLIRSRVESEVLVQELQATKLQLEEALLKEHEVAVLRERNRMAREMHDVLGHTLSLVAVKIEAAQRLQAIDSARAAAELDATKVLVRESMAELRASLADLRGPAFEAGALPLKEALGGWLKQTADEAGFALDFTFDPALETPPLPAPLQDALWRVAREAMLNAVKHSCAHKVEVHLFAKEGRVYLTVQDDGVGIPHLADGSARLEVPGHYGIRGMRERMAALGGTLSLRPGRDDKGTMLVATAPLPPSQAPSERLRERLATGTGLEYTGRKI